MQQSSQMSQTARTSKNSQTNSIITEQKQYSPRTTESKIRKISTVYDDEFRQRVDSILFENNQQQNIAQQLIRQLEEIKQFQVDRNDEILRAIKFYKNFHIHSTTERCNSNEQRSISPKSKNLNNSQQSTKGNTNLDVKDIFEKLTLYKQVEINLFMDELTDQEKQAPSLAYKKIHNKDQIQLPEQIKYFNPKFMKQISDSSKIQANSIRQYVQQQIESNIEKFHFKKPSLKQTSKYADMNWQKIEQNFKDQTSLINELQSEINIMKEITINLESNVQNIKIEQQVELEKQNEQNQKLYNEIQLIQQENTSNMSFNREVTKKSSINSRQSISNVSEVQLKRSNKQKQTDLVEKHAMLSYFRAEFAVNFDEINQRFNKLLEDSKQQMNERITQLSDEFRNLQEVINSTQLLQNVSSSVEQSKNIEIIQQSQIDRAQEIIENESITNNTNNKENSQQIPLENKEDSEINLIQEFDILRKQNDALIQQSNTMKEEIIKLNRWIKEQQHFNAMCQTKFEQRLSQVYSEHEAFQQEQEQYKQIVTTLKNSIRIETTQNLDTSFRSDQGHILNKNQSNDININYQYQQLEQRVNELALEIVRLDQKINKSLMNKNKTINIKEILEQLYTNQNQDQSIIISEKIESSKILNKQIDGIKYLSQVYDSSIYTVFGYQYLKNKLLYEQDQFYSFIEDIKYMTFLIYCDQVQISQSQFNQIKQLIILYLIELFNEQQEDRIQQYDLLFNNQKQLNFHILVNILIRNLFHSIMNKKINLLNWPQQPQEVLDMQELAQQLQINLQYIRLYENEKEAKFTNHLGGQDKISIIDVNGKFYIGYQE